MPRDHHSDLSDDALLAAYAAGEQQAAAELSARHLPRVYRHARRVLGDPFLAEDVAQDAMMRLWRVAPDWRSGDAQISTWLYRVTANLCVDILRGRKTVSLDAVAEKPSGAPEATQLLQAAKRQDALQKALNALPERQRQAVVLRHIEELANPLIAEIMGLSIRAVESQIARGKRALEEILAEQRDALGFEDDG